MGKVANAKGSGDKDSQDDREQGAGNLKLPKRGDNAEATNAKEHGVQGVFGGLRIPMDSMEFSGSGVAPRMVDRSTMNPQLAAVATGNRHSAYTASASSGESSCTNAAMMAPAAAAIPTPDATDRVMSLVWVPPNLGRPKRVVSKEASCNKWL